MPVKFFWFYLESFVYIAIKGNDLLLYNTLSYGKIFIRSNKKIYSDLNGKPLGRIGKISMETAVVSELSEQGNWLRVRRDVVPCKECLFNSICPPLSNFENATGINNSCNIWKGDGILK